ncbi:glycine--tRNA ligase subunit beta [Thalassotalea eurytherma]|uniref:Glycine--tRNA ligase beta subunit n=1 Tax=Thalassotalea eurytherma TaxID=1144278 RepID=A0ABQ6GZ12_9GAMM|nr:glycine--tRNA ligase subunit beta [Thalassotalea eurytherma]GLX80572.1 glycine--tRNA ligase beta subunit [Thalassotalea eurytherma]
MTTQTLLIELGTEELPPKSLKELAQTFLAQIESQINDASLSYESAVWFASPRRLAVKIEQLQENQEDKVVEKRGPSVTVAFDENGAASKAAEGWARSNGITVDQADRIKTDKGEWLLHKATVKGESIQSLLPKMVQQAINKLPIPKPMRWGSTRTQFIRPAHTLTMLFGREVINGEVLEVQSDRLSQGHRFHSEGLVSIEHADDYEKTLSSAYVMVDYNERQQVIKQQIEKAAQELGGNALVDQPLLDEVTALVEWPVTLIGDFDQSFLAVPAEPLIYSMKDHQKYFPVMDDNGKLLNKFIFVSNIESKDPAQVISGNEKVIRPRLADAEFFFKTDKKQPLEARLSSLESVLFQKQLGTLKDKSERIAALSQFIASLINENTEQAYRAGLLSKADLMTEMVLEFPQVQGTMGKYYAIHDGEDASIAQALEDQYRPRFAGDNLPEANIGCAVAIADKIDTLVGIFGINQAPKGDKDPFALRRAAIGLIRIIIEKSLSIDVTALIEHSIALYGDKLTNDNVINDVNEFVLGRYRAFYQEQNISVDIIQAVLAKASTAPLDFDQRVKAVAHFKGLEEATTLAAANKRVGNILAKFDGQLLDDVNADLASEDAEKALISDVEAVEKETAPLIANKEYQAVLNALAKLKTPIDNFFDGVMVMADDEAVKVNRLTLLAKIRSQFLNVADISLLQ